MVNLAKFLIEVDRDPPLFAPGNHVTGRLLLANNQKLKINKILIELEGLAEVQM